LRTRLSALVVGLFAAGLAACGGGGGGGGGGNPPPVPTPTNNSYRPAAAGDSFGYAGTMVQTFVRPPLTTGFGNATPSPNPANTETLTTAVTQAITVSAVAVAPSPFPTVASLYDFHVGETDVLNGGLKTSTITSDDYYTYTASGTSKNITFVGSGTTTSDGVTILDVIGAGNGLVDVLPEPVGAITPANTAARTTTETDPDGATVVRTTNANGTYTENGTYPDATTSQAIANADGSGSYTFPLILTIPTIPNTSYTVSAPQTATTSSPARIAITLTIPGALTGNPDPNATPLVESGSVPAWYSSPPVLSTETLVGNGGASLPASCNVSASLTRSPHQLVDTKSTIDPVFGETDLTTTTTYTEPGIGVACIVLSDVVTQYYDLSGQTQALLAFSGTPFQVTTTTETLGITAATVVGLTSIDRTSQPAVRAGVARFHAQLALRRSQRHLAFKRALVARALGGHR